jgi:hypothetical protein
VLPQEETSTKLTLFMLDSSISSKLFIGANDERIKARKVWGGSTTNIQKSF